MEKEIFKQYGGSTPEFSLNNYKTHARICSMYDADTIKAVIPIFGSFYKFSIRLMGIDTCEMKAKNPKVKEISLKARDYLFELVTSQKPDPSWKKKDYEAFFDREVHIIYLHCLEFDKWGRVLANVYNNDSCTKSMSEFLLEARLAYKYHGDTKLTEEQQLALLS